VPLIYPPCLHSTPLSFNYLYYPKLLLLKAINPSMYSFYSWYVRECRSSFARSIMEDQEPSRGAVVSRKRGPKAKICEECRFGQAKRICTHRALPPEDLDKENLALAPAQRTRRRSGVMLPRYNSYSTTSSSSFSTPFPAVLSNTGNVLPRQEGTSLTEPNGTDALVTPSP
jgi:hypothetical protein